MAGKRLLDLAALFNASRGIAQKHAALRRRQLDVYSRTSSLARAVQHQTERVTETAKAASILASRLDERAPQWSTDPADILGADRSQGSTNRVTKSADTSTAAGKTSEYPDQKPPKRAPATNLNAENNVPELEIRQEDSSDPPLPDGTLQPSELYPTPQNIDGLGQSKEQEHSAQDNGESVQIPTAVPPKFTNGAPIREQLEAQIPSETADEVSTDDQLQDGRDSDSFYNRPTHTSSAHASKPESTIPEHPSDVQEGDPHLSSNKLNSDSFYSPAYASAGKLSSSDPPPAEEEVPEGVNLNLFHSPRTARSLGGKVQNLGLDVSSPRGGKLATETKDQGRPADSCESFRLPNASKQRPSSKSVPGVEAQLGPGSDKPDAEVGSITLTQPADAKPATLGDVELGRKPETVPYELRESKVPSSRLGRLWNYGGLAAGMFGGAVSESLRRVGGSGGEGSYILSAGNMERIVSKLSRMRGAALKLGQMLSFQDSKMLPAAIQEVLQRVQDRADYMPPYQRDKVLVSNLGSNWRDLFSSFEEKPIAAASIGQVHRAVLKSSGAKVAVKVQYPGVASSIDSDLSNLSILLTASRVLPKGLFLDKTIANARTELAWECDYAREAECARRFQELLANEVEVFTVPKVFDEASGKEVLTMEFMDGVGVTRMQNFSQEQKDWIGTQILRLCLREIAEFKYMQTDPNWTNFLYNAKKNKLELLDFGASREYPDNFITTYARLLAAASKSDKKTVQDLSIELGYLTGHESKVMLDAHIASVLTLAEPFLDSSPEVYEFKDQTITERVKALIPVLIRERLAPPPEETYSLHRKLSGAFLLCARLGSRVRCRDLFATSMTKAGIL